MNQTEFTHYHLIVLNIVILLTCGLLIWILIKDVLKKEKIIKRYPSPIPEDMDQKLTPSVWDKILSNTERQYIGDESYLDCEKPYVK